MNVIDLSERREAYSRETFVEDLNRVMDRAYSRGHETGKRVGYNLGVKAGEAMERLNREALIDRARGAYFLVGTGVGVLMACVVFLGGSP